MANTHEPEGQLDLGKHSLADLQQPDQLPRRVLEAWMGHGCMGGYVKSRMKA